MAIMPMHNEMLIKIYRCPVCQKLWFVTPASRHTSCGVYHAPGSCCHYMERPVTEEELDKIQMILSQDSCAGHIIITNKLG